MDDLLDLNFHPTHQSKSSTQPSSFDHLSASIARPNSSKFINYSIPTQIQKPKKTCSNQNDAFSSLFQSNSNHQNQSDMTISQRIQAAQQKIHTDHSQKPGLPNSSSQLQINPSTSSHLNPQSITSARSSSQSWDFDLLDKLEPSQPIPNQTQSLILSEAWDTDLLSDHSQTTKSNHQLLELDTPPSILSSSIPSAPSTVVSLLGNEFGPVETAQEKLGQIALLDHTSSEDDINDILGITGSSLDQSNTDQICSPASEISTRSTYSRIDPKTSGLCNPRPSQAIHRSDSPPPHILGQVVELGFPPSLSRRALAQTRDPKTTSWDVQSAIEILLSTSHTQTPENDDRLPRDRIRKPDSMFKHVTRDTGRSNRLTTENHDSKSETINSLPNTKEIQDQAAELLAQASAYGSTALGKAASFWKQSKASLTKVIEDQTGSSSNSNDLDPPKPKWMRDHQTPSSFKNQITTSSPDLFSDKSHLDQKASGLPGFASRQAYVSSSRRAVPERTKRNPANRDSSGHPLVENSNTEDLLFSSTSNIPPLASGSKTSVTSDSKFRQNDSEKGPVIPSYSFPNWPTITLSPDLIQQSERFRAQGNDFFKQGQYSNAEASYTRALDVVLQNSSSSGLEITPKIDKIHLASLPILNNRSTAKLKNGDGKGSLSDAERVIEILLCEDKDLVSPIDKLKRRLEWTEETRIPIELKTKNFSIEDQLGKALSKRAKILEDFEKWYEAKKNWEISRDFGNRVLQAAGGLRIVTEGLRRCSKALNSVNGGMTKVIITHHEVNAANNNKTISSKDARTMNGDHQSKMVGERKAEEALKKLREKEKLLEEENNLKFESKELVDSKVLNWKSGKENNLRGLLSGLDCILWDELGWKKVNLSQLLSNSQLKINYLKAISKVHPDKIPKDATVTQRLIAESVFSTLNDAWIAMQNSSSS